MRDLTDNRYDDIIALAIALQFKISIRTKKQSKPREKRIGEGGEYQKSASVGHGRLDAMGRTGRWVKDEAIKTSCGDGRKRLDRRPQSRNGDGKRECDKNIERERERAASQAKNARSKTYAHTFIYT